MTTFCLADLVLAIILFALIFFYVESAVFIQLIEPKT